MPPPPARRPVRPRNRPCRGYARMILAPLSCYTCFSSLYAFAENRGFEQVGCHYRHILFEFVQNPARYSRNSSGISALPAFWSVSPWSRRGRPGCARPRASFATWGDAVAAFGAVEETFGRVALPVVEPADPFGVACGDGRAYPCRRPGQTPRAGTIRQCLWVIVTLPGRRSARSGLHPHPEQWCTCRRRRLGGVFIRPAMSWRRRVRRSFGMRRWFFRNARRYAGSV